MDINEYLEILNKHLNTYADEPVKYKKIISCPDSLHSILKEIIKNPEGIDNISQCKLSSSTSSLFLRIFEDLGENISDNIGKSKFFSFYRKEIRHLLDLTIAEKEEMNLLIEKYNSSIKDKVNIDKIIKDSEAAENKLESLCEAYAELDVSYKTSHEIHEKRLAEYDEKFTNRVNLLKEKIDNTNAAIIRKSLSHSFADRATSLQNEIYNWLLATTISAILFLLTIGYKLYSFQTITQLDYNTLNLQIRASVFWLPLMFLLVWIVWFCTKRYTYLCRLRDEYNYKHDLSEAYLGYKNEAHFFDGLTQNDIKVFTLLFTNLIGTICKNPIQENSNDVHSPWSELVSCALKNGKSKVEKNLGKET